METMWQQFSKEISHAIEAAGKFMVAVDGRSGHTSSGILWRPDFVITAAHAIRHDGNIGVITGPGRSVQAPIRACPDRSSRALRRSPADEIRADSKATARRSAREIPTGRG